MRRPRPVVLGLTGTYGSGKTTAAKLFERLGALRLDADAIVHRLYARDRALARSMARALGPGVLQAGRLNRLALAESIFRDARARRQLERLVHPRVRRALARAVALTRRRVVVMEVPLLFESGFDRECDATVAVLAPARSLGRRLGARARELARRNAAQWPARRKARRADYVLHNAGSRRALARGVKLIFRLFTADVP